MGIYYKLCPKSEAGVGGRRQKSSLLAPEKLTIKVSLYERGDEEGSGPEERELEKEERKRKRKNHNTKPKG